MTTNGIPTAAEIQKRIADAERSIQNLQQERDRIDHQIESYERYYNELHGRLAAAEGLRRSTMDAAAISRFIRSHPGGRRPARTRT